jgi:uncharacterized protein YjdB
MRFKLISVLLAILFVILPFKLEAAFSKPVTGVRIDKTMITLPLYEKETLRATIFPNDASNKVISWTSSDSNIVRIINRKELQVEIEAVSKGIATITAVTEDGSFKISSKVEVVVPVQKVFIEPQQITLKPGEEKEFTARVEPEDANNKNLIWQTSDSGVITVDNNGKGIAKSAGQARVIARSTENQEIFAYCIVNVGESIENPPLSTDEEIITNDIVSDEDEVNSQTNNDDVTEVMVETEENVDYILITFSTVILLLLIVLIITIRRRNT